MPFKFLTQKLPQCNLIIVISPRRLRFQLVFGMMRKERERGWRVRFVEIRGEHKRKGKLGKRTVIFDLCTQSNPPLSRLQREFKDFSPSVFAFIRGEITKHTGIPILK